MECEHAQGQAGRHQQMDVCEMGEDIRTIPEADGCNRSRAPVSGEVSNEIIGAGRAEHEGQEDHEVVRRVRVAGRPVHRNREDAGTKVALGVRERPSMWMKDIGVEHVHRIEDERSGDPGDVPDQESCIAIVDAAHGPEVKGQRRGQPDRQDPETEHDERQLTPAAMSGR